MGTGLTCHASAWRMFPFWELMDDSSIGKTLTWSGKAEYMRESGRHWILLNLYLVHG